MILRALLLALLLAAPLASQTAIPMYDNGDPWNRLDLVIVGDGYTASEMAKFGSDAGALAAAIIQEEPFREYQRYINVRRVEVASAESGADHPERNVYRNTAFDAAYNCSGIQRLVCVNTGKVLNAVAFLPPEQRDYVIVVVNDSEYGGSGGTVAVTSTNAQAVEILLHEFGHTFGGLADEYDTQPPQCSDAFEPPQPNVTKETVRTAIKWRHWIEPETPVPTLDGLPGVPGLYLGARYCPATLYRATYMSKMRVLGRPYEQINSEALILHLYAYTSPIDSYSPPLAGLTVARGGTLTFSVKTPEPVMHDLDVKWLVDGALRAHGRYFTLTTNGLPAGGHTVKARASDGTPTVRRDPGNALTDEVAWTVAVSSGAPVYSISGRVTIPGGAGLGGVTVMLGGLSVRSVTTDSSGDYTFAALESGGAYTITPLRAGYQFVPAHATVTSLGGDTKVLFAAVPAGTRVPAKVPCPPGQPCRVR
jgi:ureidoglycolate hydrolase